MQSEREPWTPSEDEQADAGSLVASTLSALDRARIAQAFDDLRRAAEPEAHRRDASDAASPPAVERSEDS